MHKSGVILAWLAILIACGAAMLTSKLVQVRNSWAKKADTLRKEADDLPAKIADAKADRYRTESELQRLGLQWGLAFERATQVLRPDQGLLQVQVGLSDAVREKQFLYGFEVQADGSSIYRGKFEVVTSAETQSSLQPAWNIRPSEAGTWQNGMWRWRTNLPAGYVNGLEEQELALIRAEEILYDRQQTVALHEQLAAEAQQQLERRVAELVGGDQLAQAPELDTEYRLGLVEAAEEVEASRNVELLEVDRLRRQVRAAGMEIRRLEAENRSLEARLPGAVPQLTSKPTLAP